MPFTKEAQVLFNQWHQELENRLRKDNLPPHLEAHLAKYKKLLPALCLIFEHMRAALDNQYPQEITYECLEKVIIWLKYFESHAYCIYGASANAIPKAATELIRRIQKDEIAIPFTAREIYQGHHWAGLSDADTVEEVLDYLIDKNYLKDTPIKTGGRPSKKYWAHPKILEQDNE